MNLVIFGIILLHLILGFGWLFYKLEFKGKKTEQEEDTQQLKNKQNINN